MSVRVDPPYLSPSAARLILIGDGLREARPDRAIMFHARGLLLELETRARRRALRERLREIRRARWAARRS